MLQVNKKTPERRQSRRSANLLLIVFLLLTLSR